MSKNLFVTGTGTDVGKTYITGLIIKKLMESGKNAAYYKAAMSGNETDEMGGLIPGDGVHVKRISGLEQPVEEMCPYIYRAAVSPHLASRLEGNPVEMEKVESGFHTVCQKYDYVTMEGSGGILCPICFDQTHIYLEDIIKRLNMSCLIVADSGLGTINDVCLTAWYMRSKNICIKGIIFNHFIDGNAMMEDNLKMCEYMTGLKVLARVKDGDTELCISEERLESLYE